MTAASNWDAPAERKLVSPPLAGSYEALFHQVGLGAVLALAPREDADSEPCGGPRLERAIGVIYRPDTGADQPLLPREPHSPVRRRDPLRSDASRRAAGTYGSLASRRSARDIPLRHLNMIRPQGGLRTWAGGEATAFRLAFLVRRLLQKRTLP